MRSPPRTSRAVTSRARSARSSRCRACSASSTSFCGPGTPSEPERERCIAGAAVSDVLEMLSPLAAEKRIRLVANLDDAGAAVAIERHQLGRVLSNLLVNAIKYTQSGGAVHLSTARSKRGVSFRVQDNGPGLSSDAVKHIFDADWVAQSTIRRGNGLGLAIARRIVEARGGKIQVSSALGGRQYLRGLHSARFLQLHFRKSRIRLTPYSREHWQHWLVPIKRAKLDSGRTLMIRLVLVDDHELFREGLRALLERDASLSIVATANDAREALQAAAQHPCDVVILDVTLPGSNGTSLVRDLKREDAGRKVLMLSMHQHLDVVFEALDNGADGYALKSQSPAELREAIRAVAAGERYLAPSLRDAVSERNGRGLTTGLSARALQARARDLRPARARLQQQRHRQSALHQHQDRRDASHAHHEEARGAQHGRAHPPRRAPRPPRCVTLPCVLLQDLPDWRAAPDARYERA